MKRFATAQFGNASIQKAICGMAIAAVGSLAPLAGCDNPATNPKTEVPAEENSSQDGKTESPDGDATLMTLFEAAPGSQVGLVSVWRWGLGNWSEAIQSGMGGASLGDVDGDGTADVGVGANLKSGAFSSAVFSVGKRSILYEIPSVVLAESKTYFWRTDDLDKDGSPDFFAPFDVSSSRQSCGDSDDLFGLFSGKSGRSMARWCVGVEGNSHPFRGPNRMAPRIGVVPFAGDVDRDGWPDIVDTHAHESESPGQKTCPTDQVIAFSVDSTRTGERLYSACRPTTGPFRLLGVVDRTLPWADIDHDGVLEIAVAGLICDTSDYRNAIGFFSGASGSFVGGSCEGHSPLSSDLPRLFSLPGERSPGDQDGDGVEDVVGAGRGVQAGKNGMELYSGKDGSHIVELAPGTARVDFIRIGSNQIAIASYYYDSATKKSKLDLFAGKNRLWSVDLTDGQAARATDSEASLIVVPDLDGDGGEDIILEPHVSALCSNILQMYSGKTGDLLGTLRGNCGAVEEKSIPLLYLWSMWSVGDTDSDGKNEILILAQERNELAEKSVPYALWLFETTKK